MLYLLHSNRLENLAAQLSAVMQTDPLDPFKAETIVVQNAGMGRWLSLQLAQQDGIAANIKYLFPAEMTWELLRIVLPDVPQRDPCSPKLLRWRLLKTFVEQLPDWQAELGHYLQADDDSSAWQLAQQMAAIFDGYLFFRPDWVKRWEAEPSKDWQERLWQTVISEPGLPHWIQLQNRFIQALEQNAASVTLPRRILFFSVPALSPAYIEMMGKVAEKADVYFFIMNPSWQYWGDIESAKRRIKFDLPDQAYVTVGNPLLASWGRQGRDFIETLRAIEPYPEEFDAFAESESDSLLACIQNDILNLEGEAYVDVPDKPEQKPVDSSIKLHSCHSAMREVEVLYDQLLDAFAQDDSLRADDVIVMSPAIEHYAPLIQAVFAHAQVNLPYSIADQRYPNTQSPLKACLQLLELPESRFEAERLLSVLEYPEIYEHFGLDNTQLQQCREWLLAVDIRWGIDQAFRRERAPQASGEHTWMQGLERLLLGYMLPGEQLFHGVLPCDRLEGQQVEVLEALLRCLSVLFPLADWHKQSLTMAQWVAQFQQLLRDLFSPQAALYSLTRALDGLLENTRQAEFSDAISWLVFRSSFKQALEQTNQADGFLGHGITFCTLMPMRSVPFRFVALLGMQDGDFPRRDERSGLDRMGNSSYRRGDRSRRDEDRYLFLESLLSARNTLYISYIGQSIIDNNPIMPSVLVSELLDYIEQRFAINTQVLITQHPLQAFSMRYFSDEPLFTYNSTYQNLQRDTPKAVNPFWQYENLPPLDESWRHIDLSELIRFYRQPARTFLQYRFDLDFIEQDDLLPEREPFQLEAFVDSDVRALSLQSLQQDIPQQDLQKIARAQGLLPHGQPGARLFSQQLALIQELYNSLPENRQEQTVHLDFSYQSFQLRGNLHSVTAEGQWHLLPGYQSAWQWLEIWLMHLALQVSELPDGFQRHSHVLALDKSYVLSPIDAAEQQLGRLLQGYWEGLQYPLAFFPRSAWAMIRNSKMDIHAAYTAWRGNEQFPGESSKPEYRLLYPHQNPLITHEQEFLYWAEQIFMDLGRFLK